jgi:hypothetical protein
MTGKASGETPETRKNDMESPSASNAQSRTDSSRLARVLELRLAQGCGSTGPVSSTTQHQPRKTESLVGTATHQL